MSKVVRLTHLYSNQSESERFLFRSAIWLWIIFVSTVVNFNGPDETHRVYVPTPTVTHTHTRTYTYTQPYLTILLPFIILTSQVSGSNIFPLDIIYDHGVNRFWNEVGFHYKSTIVGH